MRYIKGIDLLRFLGAISVIFLHLGSLNAFKKAGLLPFHILIDGNTGVVLFYVISGFLITSIIMADLREGRGFSWLAFVRNRAMRIFPLYYFALVIYVLVGWIGIQKTSNTSLLFAFTYTYNFIPKQFYDTWLGSFHTLATEEHFYLLYPILWAAALRFRFPLWPLLLAVGLSGGAAAVLTQGFADDFLTPRWTVNAWAPIFIGCLFGFVYSRADASPFEGSLAFLAGFAFLFASLIIAHNAIIMAVAFGLLLLHFAYNQDRTSTKLLGGPLFRYLGGISYGLYVWQSFVISTGTGRRIVDSPYVAVPLIFALATATWLLIEKPMAKLRGRMTGPKSAESNPAPIALQSS